MVTIFISFARMAFTITGHNNYYCKDYYRHLQEMKQPFIKKYIPLMALFIVINILVFIFKSILFENGFEINFILAANAILFLITFFGFLIQARRLNSANINAFLRGIYASLLMKMFIIMAAVFIYVLMADGKVNKPALFTSMGIYILYTSIEVIQLMKIVRKNPNA